MLSTPCAPLVIRSSRGSPSGALAALDRVVVLCHEDQSVAGGDDVIHGRVELRLSAGRNDADEARRTKLAERIAERSTNQGLVVEEVDLVATEVEQLHVDDGQSRLPDGLRGDAADELAAEHQLRLSPAGQARDVDVARVAYLGHDAVRLGPPVRDRSRWRGVS